MKQKYFKQILRVCYNTAGILRVIIQMKGKWSVSAKIISKESGKYVGDSKKAITRWNNDNILWGLNKTR